MKTLSANMVTHLQEDLTTLATCWKITRTDGTIFRFTDHDVDLVVDGGTYKAATGMVATALSSTRSLAADNMEATSIFDSEAITEDDLLAGKFDNALVDVFRVNWADIAGCGKIYLAKGWMLGRVELRENTFTVEVRSLTQKLDQNIVELCSPACRAVLGDVRCGVNLASFTETGNVTSVISRRKFRDTGLGLSSDVLQFGTLTWTTGSNDGVVVEVKSFEYQNGEIELFDAMVNDIQVGDAFTVTHGCDKQLSTCRDRFLNHLNFRGEPWVPGDGSLPLKKEPDRSRGVWRR